MARRGNKFGLVMRGLVAGLIFGLALIGGVPQARASTVVVDFTVVGGNPFPADWVGSPPYGLSPDPTISGAVTIDDTLTDGTAFTAINWVTGSRTWTLADINIAASSVFFSGGVFQTFAMFFTTPGNYVYSSNTVLIQDHSNTMYCNFCVIVDSIEVIGATTPLPAALPLFATGLGAMGLLGWRRKRKATALAA